MTSQELSIVTSRANIIAVLLQTIVSTLQQDTRSLVSIKVQNEPHRAQYYARLVIYKQWKLISNYKSQELYVSLTTDNSQQLQVLEYMFMPKNQFSPKRTGSCLNISSLAMLLETRLKLNTISIKATTVLYKIGHYFKILL